VRTFIISIWTDEVAFKTACATVGRFLIAFAGWLVDQGFIPTGISGGGQRFGLLAMALAFLVPAGRPNPRTKVAVIETPGTTP